jgi:hypothetical protein
MVKANRRNVSTQKMPTESCAKKNGNLIFYFMYNMRKALVIQWNTLKNNKKQKPF